MEDGRRTAEPTPSVEHPGARLHDVCRRDGCDLVAVEERTLDREERLACRCQVPVRADEADRVQAGERYEQRRDAGGVQDSAAYHNSGL